ncbi:MAG: DEAD/DEAH box helicase family protein, partial [Spirochaetales bacterium]
MIEFNNPFEYKVIYVFSITQQSHAGLLKIGDTTLKTATAINKLFPNSSELKRAAKERIDSYTQTAGIAYNLLYTDLAIKTSEKNGEKITQSFRDFDVRRVLKNSGYMQAEIDGSTGREWVKADIDSVIDAIDAVKINKKFIKNARSQDEDFTPIDFRPEQRDAIAKTVKRLKKHNKMLWNAKMRFGKTVCALQVIKEMNFAKTIIITHRPVVNDGWREDFDKIFYDKKDDFIYASKSLGISIEDLEKTCKNYVYFMSVQDLRGSEKVGGTFDKNDEVFNIDWDFVIVDEAHEGTTTERGENVTAELIKENTKKLELSGTPFNIVDKFNDEELYTWDYVMEQKAKTTWGEKNFGDGNPYDSLPKLNIFTYNLGNLVGKGEYQEIEDKAFNFREFFRTWTGNGEQDCMPLPHNAHIGDFVHEQDVISFLNLITKENAQNNYPYASKENRELFQHALWMLPGVKEAKALSALLDSHSIFGSGQFDIINVAGDGDDNEEESKEALQKVKEGIAKASKLGNSTITLSCGKLTTGVTIPEWTAVMMLSGS